MSLIDSTYFVKDIAIPNIDEFVNTFQSEIELYEKEVLRSLLGYRLWKEFTDALAGGDPIDQKWLDLRDGAEFSFEVDGVTVNTKWEGLINSDKRSLIAYYVYCKSRENGLSTTTSINDVVGIPENAEKVNNSSKLVTAWNNFIKLYGSLDWYVLQSGYYSGLLGFNKYDTTYSYYNDHPSAYNFLNANRANYDNWEFQPIDKLNRFDL
jgi:hypothetical protein